MRHFSSSISQIPHSSCRERMNSTSAMLILLLLFPLSSAFTTAAAATNNNNQNNPKNNNNNGQHYADVLEAFHHQNHFQNHNFPHHHHQQQQQQKHQNTLYNSNSHNPHHHNIHQNHHQHSSLIKQLSAPVGRPFTFAIAEGHSIDAEMLPSWCMFNTNLRQIYGIPQVEDVGLHLIAIHDSHIEVDVEEEDEDFCGIESSTIWLEIMDARQLGSMTIEEQFQTLQNLLGFLKESQLSMNDVRVFPRSYLARYRNIEETIHELEEERGNNRNVEEVDEESIQLDNYGGGYDGRASFVLNISCGELTDQGSEAINSAVEHGMPFQVVEGELRKDRPPIPTTLPPPTTTAASTRTTRRVQQNHENRRPLVLNPLRSFNCTRGMLCRLSIPENVFVDEDGHTSRLALSVHPIDGDGDLNGSGNNNFLVVVPGENLLLEGVPVTEEKSARNEEQFNFRLEARDSQNAASSTPFQVVVKRPTEDEPKPNHRYNMILNVPVERFHTKPEFMREFVYRLSAILRRLNPVGITKISAATTQEQFDAAAEIHVDRAIDNGSGQTLLQWWDNTISRTQCDEQRINATRDRMVHQHHHEKIRHEFVKQMGAQFHVKNVSLELLGKCLVQHLLDTMRMRVYTTTQRNTLADEVFDRGGDGAFLGGWAQTLLVPLILVATILLLLTVLTLLCCAHHRRGKKVLSLNRRNEYTTKGRPVVFPDEVPHRDEGSSADGSLATVTTPMLLEREQPPLDPEKMTMHENPLYRPPPQLQAQLVRKGASPLGGNSADTLAVQQRELSPLSGGSPGRQMHFGQQQHQTSSPPAQQRPQLASTFSPPGALRAIDASPTPQRAYPPPSTSFQREHPQQQSVRFHQTPVGQRLPPPYLAH